MGSCSESRTTGDLSDIDKIYAVGGALLLLGSTWMDGFILTVNFRDWMKKKCLSTTDRILTLQGSLRIWLGFTMTIWFILEKLCHWILKTHYFEKTFTFIFWYFIACDVWLMASLCSYYCVKIADFSHPFFIHLKLRLSRLESVLLLSAAILALASSLPFVCIDFKIQCNRNFSDVFQNKNLTDISHQILALRMHVILGVGFLAAFSICATSAALLVFSLWRHRQRMLGSWGGHRNPQINAHFQAVVTILSLLINNVIVFVSIQLVLSRYYEEHSLLNYVASVLLYSSFSVEPLISIWGNKKLKNELRRSLYFVKCRGCVR